MKKEFILVSMTMLFLLASCSRVESVYHSDPKAIEFVSVVHPSTRVPLETTRYRDMDSMRVSAYLADAEATYADRIGSYFEDVLFYKNKAGEGWVGVQFWPLYSAVINFSLVSQAHNKTNVHVDWGNPAASQAIIRLTDNDVLDQTDLMYGGGKGVTDGNGNYSPVSVLFHHALSMISFSFSSTLYEFVNIKKVELVASYNGTLTVDYDYDNKESTIDHASYSTPSWSPDPVQSMLVPNKSYDGPCEEALLTQVEVAFGAGLMAIPSNTNDRKIVITYLLKQSNDNGGYEWKEYSHIHTVTEEWLPGKKYHYSIKMAPQALSIMPSMEAWPSVIKYPHEVN